MFCRWTDNDNICKETLEYVHIKTGYDAIVSAIRDSIDAAKSLERLDKG